MSWITLTEADIHQALNSTEIEAYRGKIDAAQDDPLTGILTDVTAELRGYLVTRYTLPASGIPQSLKNSAVDIAVHRLCKRVHTGTEQTRKDAADAAFRKLDEVAAGRIGVEDATDSTGPASANLPSVTAKTTTYDRTSQDGL